jgi:hypothetical protein
VVNVITGRTAEIAEHLAAHADINGLDLAGAAADELVPLQVLAANTLKRVLAPLPGAPAPDWSAQPGLERMLPFLETKTVWHPKGL